MNILRLLLLKSASANCFISDPPAQLFLLELLKKRMSSKDISSILPGSYGPDLCARSES